MTSLILAGLILNIHTDQKVIDKTRKMIEEIAREVEEGKEYLAKVVKVEDFILLTSVTLEASQMILVIISPPRPMTSLILAGLIFKLKKRALKS